VARRSGIVTLTTDFGTRDAYVGAMKGVICSIFPGVRLVDITHEIRPQKVLEAALLLEAAYPWFPAGTVHLVVVDPGVGSRRRPMAVAADGQIFVGPDNGVLSAALGGRAVQAHEIVESAYELPTRSDTFHGRDVFAPAAGHLAAGLTVDFLGPVINDPVLLELPKPVIEGNQVVGEILRIDRFGNALSSVPRVVLQDVGAGPYEVLVADKSYGRLRRRYDEVDEGEPIALTGGNGRLQIAVNGGAAGESLGIQPGDKMIVRPLPKKNA